MDKNLEYMELYLESLKEIKELRKVIIRASHDLTEAVEVAKAWQKRAEENEGFARKFHKHATDFANQLDEAIDLNRRLN